MAKFDYSKAHEDLWESGCSFADEVFDYTSEKGFDGFKRENGLDPDKYHLDGHSGSGSGFGGGYSGGGSFMDDIANGFVDGLFGGSGGSSDGCYLTTACVEARNLPDDCEELQTLRMFRDTYLSNREGGKEDIQEYYAMAPQVVERINHRSDAKEIWNRVYENLVVPCVRMIKDGMMEETYRLYKRYALDLEIFSLREC